MIQGLIARRKTARRRYEIDPKPLLLPRCRGARTIEQAHRIVVRLQIAADLHRGRLVIIIV